MIYEILKDEIKEYKAIASYMQNIVDNKIKITRAIAKDLERKTGCSSQMWLGLAKENTYN